MGFALCNKSTYEVQSWARWSDFDGEYDPLTQIVVEADAIQDTSEWRWDGATGIRQETTAERTTRLDDAAEEKAEFLIDRELKAFALALKDQFPSLDLQQLRSDFIFHWKQL